MHPLMRALIHPHEYRHRHVQAQILLRWIIEVGTQAYTHEDTHLLHTPAHKRKKKLQSLTDG